MKKYLLFAIFCSSLPAADLPTISLEHLYYLKARSGRVAKFKPDEMIEYCLVQKLGGNAFENLYAQVFSNRIEVAKLLQVEAVDPKEARVVELNKTYEVLSKILNDEALKIQNGILSEGLVASDTLQGISIAQENQPVSR
jgi:hypothetical protein